MKKDYVYFKHTDDLSQNTTINIFDILDVWKNLKQAKVESGKTVIVCKKQATNLDHLIELFSTRSPFLQKKKVLIVDDEADFASRNYKNVKLQAVLDENGNPMPQCSETEMAKISQQIDDFRKIPEFCRYLQVTATPYCLYLQPQGELNLNGNIVKPFKPRFTTLVPIHSGYIGGKEYFELSKDPESMYSHLYHQVDQKCIDVLKHEDKRYLFNSVSSNNIYGLTNALVSYLMATAIRRIQERAKGKDYSTSAIIHVEIDKKNHDWQYRVVNRLINDIAKAIIEDDQADQRIWTAIDVVYNDFKESNQKGCAEGLISVDLPSLEETLAEIKYILAPHKGRYHVQVVNSDEEMSSLLDEESGELELGASANIFIGGNILDRGITIKNLLCFFYGRNPKNFQQDTVLQHARMYGARSKEDMAVMRLHTTSKIYKVLARMNELDNQLREWFLAGNDQSETNAVFVGFDKNIKPCAPQKIKISNALTLKPQMRMVPSGFWTGSKTATAQVIAKIDRLIENALNSSVADKDGFFEMDKSTVVEILQLIESTYLYDDKYLNSDRKNDIKEMLCALEYCTSKSGDKMFALQRTNRNMNRVRANGGWIDAPDDGHTDLAPARKKAQQTPVVMFLRQNGSKNVDPQTGENVGWNNAPFYWPVLVTQAEINPVMYALDQRKQKEAMATANFSDILEGINPDEILKMVFDGDLLQKFGEPGTDHDKIRKEGGDSELETRALKESTASLFLMKDDNGNYMRDPNVSFDFNNDHGVYSRNHGRFPFVLRPYKYMLLWNKRNSTADVMLLELVDASEFFTVPSSEIDDDGYLIDRDTEQRLINTKDEIMHKDMTKKAFTDTTIVQWIIVYPIKKVLRYKQGIQPNFDEEEDEETDND